MGVIETIIVWENLGMNEPLCGEKCNFERDCNQTSQQGPRG